MGGAGGGPGGGPARRRPDSVSADKAYSSRKDRGRLHERGVKAVTSEKTDQAADRKREGSAGGRPVTHDTALYEDGNSVERCFARLEQWRGVATRYDKLSESYEAGLLPAGVMRWIRSP